MMLQAMCVGIPLVVWPQTSYQLLHVEAWKRFAPIYSLHSLNDIPEAWALMKHRNTRFGISQKLQSAIDGKGAERLADAVQAVSANNV